MHHHYRGTGLSFNNPPPNCFLFPCTVLPNPAVVLWETHELHILAVIASGSLYRLILLLQTPQQLCSTHMVNNWCHEYHLKYVQEHLQALFQVQGPHMVALGLPDGSCGSVTVGMVLDSKQVDT